MSLTVIYRNGVFEPLERVELEDNSRLRIDIIGPAPEPPAVAQTGWRRFSLGLMAPPGPDFKELGPEWKEYTE